MVEGMKMRLTMARFEGWADAELGNQLLSEIHGLMEKLGAGLHQQMYIGNTVLDDVMVEVELRLFAFHFLEPFPFF